MVGLQSCCFCLKLRSTVATIAAAIKNRRHNLAKWVLFEILLHFAWQFNTFVCICEYARTPLCVYVVKAENFKSICLLECVRRCFVRCCVTIHITIQLLALYWRLTVLLVLLQQLTCRPLATFIAKSVKYCLCDVRAANSYCRWHCCCGSNRTSASYQDISIYKYTYKQGCM